MLVRARLSVKNLPGKRAAAPSRRAANGAPKVGCGLLLAVLFCAAAVSRAPFVVFLLALAMVFTAFLWWDARTLRRQMTAALQLPAKPVRPGEAFAVTVHLQNAGRRTVPELRAVLRAEDAESGTAIELPCAAMLAPGTAPTCG